MPEIRPYFAYMIAIISPGWKKGGMISVSQMWEMSLQEVKQLAQDDIDDNWQNRIQPTATGWGTSKPVLPLNVELHSSPFLTSAISTWARLSLQDLPTRTHISLYRLYRPWVKARRRPKEIPFHFKIRTSSWKT